MYVSYYIATHHEDVAISKEERLIPPKRTTRNMHPLINGEQLTRQSMINELIIVIAISCFT
jgi:hypothetical protein